MPQERIRAAAEDSQKQYKFKKNRLDIAQSQETLRSW